MLGEPHGSWVNWACHARMRPRPSAGPHTGEMAERFKAPVLKTGEGSFLPWVRIPLSPPDTQSAPKGAFCVCGGEKRVPRPRGFDGFARSESGQPNGWPWSAPRGRVGCMDALNNPRPPITIITKRPVRGVWRIWRREKGADAARVRRIRRERIRTAEWLALERAGRKGWVHGCTQQSQATDRYQHRTPRKGRLAYLAERKGCRRRAGSTDSPGADPDSRMAGPGARRAEGLGA